MERRVAGTPERNNNILLLQKETGVLGFGDYRSQGRELLVYHYKIKDSILGAGIRILQ